MHISINQLQINISETTLLSTHAEAIVHDTDTALSIPAWLAEAAGELLVQEAHFIGWCDIGSAVATSAGKLEAKQVIHVVGPRWGDESARGKLANAIWAVLELAQAKQLTSLALPPVSTGAKGYPIENCAKVMLE